MSYKTGIVKRFRLAADQQVAASTALVTITGSDFVLPAGKEAIVEMWLPINLGATGGFKVQLTSSQVLADYALFGEGIDGVAALPGSEISNTIVAQAAFASAFAVAGNHSILIKASLKGHATLDSTISPQFACNSAANAITVLKGAVIEVTLL